jgi:hypothetical protein
MKEVGRRLQRQLGRGSQARGCEIGGRQRDAQAHILAVDHEHKALCMWGGRDGEQRKAAPEQWMARIGDLDLGQRRIIWVVEGGIDLGDSWGLTTKLSSRELASGRQNGHEKRSGGLGGSPTTRSIMPDACSA